MTQSTRDSRADRTPRPWRSVATIAGATLAVSIYLFVTAPPPLAARIEPAGTVPIRAVFAMLEVENDAARAMWTEDIVNRGQAVGLAFQESWRDERVHAGPLPALFLRETARHLERNPLRLRLFLGSRYPINQANLFTGQQADRFALLEETGAPQMFVEPSTGLQTAMFPDRAVVEACVTCHNEHRDSPKANWKLHALMGATTWMYPEESVTLERAVEMIGALRGSIRAAYTGYLQEVASFPKRPEIGAKWPRDGFYLPDDEVFMRELARRTSPITLRGLLDPTTAEVAAASEVSLEPAPIAPPRPAVAEPVKPAAPATLVIRATRSTRVTVDHGQARLMVARLPAGGSTSLTSRPPLRIKLSEPEGVELEYDGKPVPIPAGGFASGDLEVTLPALVPEKS